MTLRDIILNNKNFGFACVSMRKPRSERFLPYLGYYFFFSSKMSCKILQMGFLFQMSTKGRCSLDYITTITRPPGADQDTGGGPQITTITRPHTMQSVSMKNNHTDVWQMILALTK